MNQQRIRTLLRQVADRKLSIRAAAAELEQLPFVDLGFSRLDTHRNLRTGVGEVIYTPSKTVSQVVAIFKRYAALGERVFATRANPEVFAAVKKTVSRVRYYETARILALGRFPRPRSRRTALVVCAGTSDIPVAEEAAVTAGLLGSRVERLYDVGVAGIHRLFNDLARLRQAQVLVVVAGMEGALASVVGGLVRRPVIAVPTSVGYGSGFGGLAPLLTMLNSCAPGIAVVNIDNGFGAGYFAHRILTLDRAR